MRYQSSSPKGFTLLEIILALSILAIMMTMIFSITTSSITLGNNIVQAQAEARHQSAFYNYLSNVFNTLPSEATITLEPNDQDFQTLTITTPNTPFPALGRQHIAKQLWLSISKDRNALASLNLECSNQLDSESYDSPAITFRSQLNESLADMRWEFYQANHDQWTTEWTREMGRPAQIKLYYRYPGELVEHMHYFWIPQRQNPQIRANTRTP